jgi:hypothetical protein
MGWGGFLVPWGGDPGLPAQFQTATESPLSPLLADISAEYNFVLEGRPYRQNAVDAGWPDAWGAFPWGWGGESTAETLRYSWRGFVTSGTDTPPNEYIPATLLTPVNHEMRISPQATGGGFSGTVGQIEFVASIDDDIEAWWSGRSWALKYGGTYDRGLASETVMPFSDYGMLYRFVSTDLSYSEDTAQLGTLDYMHFLDQPIQQSIYAGTGVYEGDDQIKGQFKPLVYGSVFNVPAITVDSNDRIYQVHDGAVSDITDVRDNGNSLTDQGDTTNLPGWSSGTGGQYKTDVSRGLFKVSSDPTGQVTADVVQTVTAAGEVLREMADDAGFSNRDEASFFGFNTADVGVYIGTAPVTVRQAMQDLAGSLDGWVFATREGNLRVETHRDSVLTMPEHTIEGRREADAPCTVISIRRIDTPPAPYRVRVAYKRNWSPQTLDSISEANKQLYAQEYQVTDIASNANSKDINPNAQELFLQSGYIVNEADAITLRDDIVSRAHVKRDLFEVAVTAPRFQILPGHIVKIFYDRFGLSNGRQGEVLTVVESAEITTLQIMVMQ